MLRQSISLCIIVSCICFFSYVPIFQDVTPSSLLTHRISFLQQSHLTQTEQSDYQDKDISANIKQTAPAGDRPMSAPTNHLQTMARGRVRASSNTASLNTASNNIITVCADANCDHNSVHEAVSAAQPGDHIKIATGTYKNPDIAAEGRFLTINKEITLSGGYDGTDWSTADPIANPTILDGEEQGAGLYMQTGGITVTVQGLTIQRARGQGIYASNTRVIIDNSHIISTTGSSNSAISLSSSHGSQIRRSTIQHSATAISLSSSHDVVIEDNTIEQNSTGVSLVASHRFLIKRNRIIRNTGSGLTANYWSSSSNGTITANIIAKNGGTGLFINGSRQQIDNNMIVINDGYGIDWRSGNGIMYHNTIADNDGDAGVYVQSGVNVVLTNTIISGHTYGIRTASASGNVQANHTLWFSNTNDTAATGGLNIVTTNDLHDNPLFVGTGESWDAYHLTFASPAIDAGGATDIDKDVDGEGRAPNIGPDIGADEYPHVLTLSDGQSETTTPNSTVTYVHILRNSGGVTDTVNLTANSSQNWAVSVEPSQVTVGVGMAVPVTVTVLVPADAGTDMTTLTAQSTLDGHAIHTVTDVTSTEAGMTLTPNHSEMHDPGSTVTYVHTLTNVGPATDAFDLILNSSQGWTTLVTPSPVTLNPNESAMILLVLDIPLSAAEGTVEQATLRAISTNAPLVTASIDNKTTILDIQGTRYASTSGNDTDNSCLDSTKPCLTLKHAHHQALPGDHIKMAGGLYTNPDIAVEGRFVTVDRNLTLSGGYDGSDWTTANPLIFPTILDSEDQGTGLYMQTSGITVTVQGLTIQRARGQGIYASGTRVIIENSHIISMTGSSNSAISFSSSHGSQIRRSVIQHSTTAISLGSSHDVVIEDNTIERNITGISLVTSHRFVISRNRIIHNTGNGSTTNYWSSSSNGTIIANIIAENGGTGLFINGSGQQIDNNMIVANNGYGVDWRAGNGVMHHNTIADNDGDAGLYVQSGVRVALTNTIISGHTYGIRTASANGNVQANHTLWFSNTKDTAASGGLNISTTHNMHGNPMFVGTGETWDAYHLTSASPAIDAGIATNIHTDIDGQGRAPDIAPDIGADEYPHVLTLSDGQSETTTPNSTVAYVHTLRNSGGFTGTVNLTANSSQNWTVSVAPTQVTLGVGMTTPVTVTLLVPVDASEQTDVTQLTARSTLDINAHHTITNVTGIGAGLSLTPNHNASLPAEGTIVYEHVLTNKGTAADTINLSLNSSQGWASIVSDNPVVLDAGQSATVQVQVNVPLAAAAGVVDATTLTAVSTNANQVTASSHNETTATATPGTRYVSTTGNDMGNSCLDRIYPCLTLEHAHRQAQPDDHIKMAGGLYTNPDIAVEGRFVTVDRNLTLSGGYDGNDWTTANPQMFPTILDSEYQGTGLYMQTDGITVTVQGLTIQRARGQGIYAGNTRVIIDNSHIISTTGSSNSAISLSSSHGSQIRRSTIQHSATAISLSSSHDVVIEDNTIERNSTGISLVASHRFVINRNRITHNIGSGLTTNYWSSSSNGIITANIIAENGGTGLFINGSGQQIDNNMIVANNGYGVDWRAGNGFMHHNTIANNDGDAGLYVQFSARVALTNTIISGHTYGIRTASTSGYVQANHTLWFSNTDNTAASGGLNISTTHDVHGNPMFVGTGETWDAYHLTPASPAIDAGIATSIHTDIDGQGRAPDIGADEYPHVLTLNDGQSETTTPNSTVTYVHTLRNSGGVTDTVNLSANSSQNWSVSVAPTQVTLGVGMTTPVTVTLLVPVDASGQTDVTQVTAQSTLDINAHHTITNVTGIGAGLSLTPNHNASLPAEGTIVYAHVLTNKGTAADTINLSLNSSQGWASIVSDNPVVLDAGASITAQVQANVPLAAAAGVVDATTLTAVSTNANQVTASAHNETTATATPGTRYISTTGNDMGNSCLDRAYPCLTLEHAHQQAQSGDHIKMAGGLYTNPDIAVEGRFVTLNRNLTLSGGYDGNEWTTANPLMSPTILDGEHQGVGLYMQTGGITVTVQGLTIQRARGQGIYASNTRVIIDNSQIISMTGSSNSAISLSSSHGSQIRRSTIQHSATAISLSSSHDVVIEDSTIEQNSTGISLFTSHRFLINRNRITHNTGNGLTTNYWSSSSNGTITANTIAENGGTGLFINGSGQQIDNNMIVVNDANGISWRTGSGIMRHNTIADNNGQAGLSIESASVVLTNTIIAGHTYGIHTVYGGANVQADHTLWHNNSEGNTYAESGTISTTNNFTSTPGFIGGEDAWTAYHLAPTSVAIDAGVATGVVSDIDGNSRPYDAGYDLGADEYPGTAITLNGVTVSGPATGMVQEPVFLTATVRPLTATLPITYVWTASGGVAPIRQVDTLENEVALVWHTLGTQIVTTTATNEAGTTVDTHTVELLPPPTAAFPFYDGFETGELAPEWRIFSGPQGRVRIDNSHAQEGRWSVLLDNAVSDDTLDYASLLLTINLSGQTNPVLSFWWKTFGDENHPQDGVFISDDYGKTWHQAFSLNYGSASYQQSFVDLGTVAQQYGLTLHDHVQLKFQFYDDRPIPGDGYAIDEVRVMPAQPLNTVQLTGPASGMAQSGLSFVASVRPETTTPPITYRWQASGQAEQVQVDNLSNEATFIWDEAGPKMVTVVVSNSLGTATDTFTVDVTPYVPETFADLRVQEFTAPATGRTDDTVTVAWRVQNQGGNETNVATWRDRIYLSPDASLDPDTDLALATQTHTGIIAADADYLASATVVMPEVTTGEYYLFVVTDVDNVVNENQNENNNQSTPALPIYLESGPPDLQLAMSAIAPSNSGMSSNYALAGSVITYTLTVANNGLQVAEDVTLNIVLPAGTTLHSQSSGGSFSQADNVLTWQLGVLQPDEETMVQVAATIDAAMAGDGAAVITNRAEVVTSSPEENIDDNVATVNTTVEQPVARFSATPTTPFIAVTAGHSAQYTVTLKNTGAAATGELQLTPPPHISWVTVAPATLPSLAAGATTHVIITASPPADLRSGYYRDLLSISRANAQPTLIGLTVEVSGERQPLHIHVQNDQGAAVAGASVQLTKQQPWLGVTEGVTTERAERVTATSDSNGMAVFDDIEVGAYTYLAIASAHENANGTVEVLGGQPSDVPQEVIINMTSQAILHVRPNTPIIGVVQGDTQNQVITIINNGAAPLTGIQITPPASIPWVYLGVPDPVPTLAVGEEMAFTIYANAAKDQATNIYQDYLTVSAANGDSRQIALTVEVTDQVVRDVEIQVADTVNQPIANGSVTLIQQEPTSQIIGEQETTFNQHYSEQIDAEGMVQFTALAPGDYNYVIRADGYDQGTGVLEVMAGTGQQRETVLLDPAPFDATWEVVPLDGQYAITLTLTYDTGSNETPPPVVFIPERKWWFSTCHPQVFDIIEIFNPSPIAVNLSDLFFDVEGVEVTPAVFPQGIPPFDSIRVPVTATHIGDLEQENGVMLPFSYEAVPDELVTFTFNPSSATSPVLNTGETFAQTYLLEPVEFVPDVQYTVEFASPNQFSWIQVTSALGAGAWTEATAIAFNLAVTPPATLADGVYNDEIHVRVTGNDGAIREGTLKIDVTKTGDRFQVHTHFELGPIPYHLHLDRTYSTIETGYHEIEPVDCETIGENPPEDKFVWSIIVDRGLIGHFSGPGVIAPNLPTYVTPPVIGYDHQQVRLEISQELLLEGEGFRANLTMDNTSDAPIEVVEIDIRVADLDGTDQTTGFTFIPETPTALGTVDVGGHVAGEWLILPDNLNVTSPDGQNYQVSAVIHYTWGGIRTSVETVPRQITVYPAPELVITYELPLSEQNCTNFRVKTTISNQGIGIARGLRFRSTQPSIIDNQSQLLIGFEIVATLVNSVPQGASFDLSLGDVSPGDTVEITWQLQASLPGRFVGFSSDFQQSNYQGQLLPPLIREINTVFVPTDPVNGNCASVQNLRSNPPLLIVHGIQTFDMGGEGFVCRDEPVEFTGFNSTIGNDLPRWLTENYNVWLAHLEAVPLRSSRPDYDAWGNLPPIATNARCLEKQVEYLYKLTGRKLTMVAHSMGGLVSRACLSSAHTEILGFTFGSRGCRDKVRALYTMGSPHGGINTISHLKLLAAERKWTSSLADQLCDAQAPLCEMSSENMWHFNRRYLNDPNVNYTFIGGDHTPLIRYDLWIKEYDIGPIIEELDGKHDGIVGRYSAVGWKAGETGFDPPAWPQASPPTQYWTDEVHFTEFGGGNSYYDARGESLELSQSYGCIAHREYKLNEIERHLHPESPIDAIYEQRPETCRPVDSNIQLRNVDSNMATQTPSQEQAIPFQTINSSSGALIAGQSISYTVMMDNEGESLFLTSWIGDNVSAVLIRPDGQRITPEYAITQPTVSYEHIEGGPAYPPSASYYFTQTLPGLWHVILEHDGSSAEAIAYTSYVAAPSSLQLNVTQPLNTYQIDETVTLTATLVLGGIPVQDGVVTATVIRPDGVEVELTLEARGNGLYQTDYRLPDMPGYSIVEVTARGVTNGIEYTRQSDVLWTVAPRDAQFTENVSDQAIDFDNDSLMDALLVGVEIQVSEPATYVVSAQIAHNTVIIDSTSLNIPIHISGTYSVPLVFDGQYIHDVQLDGPYTIVNAVIRAEQFGTIAIDQIDLLHTTEAYQNFTKPVPPPDDNTNTSQPHIIHVNITPITITANSTSTAIITATVTDAANTPLIDQTISFTTTLGTISPLTATTNSSGVVTTTLTVDNQPGIATITAYADAITATTSVTFTVVETPTVPVIPVPPAPISLTDVRLIAATHGVPDIDYTFTAIGVPFNATPPVTYTWQATDQPDVVQAGGIVNAVTWSWATMGVKEITVVAQNALAVVTQTHTITIQEQVWTHLTAPTSVMIEGDSVGAVDVSYPFTATIAPADATPPLFYVWHTSENLPVIQMRHITSTVNFTWTTPGVKEIHLSAANLLGTVTDTYTMTIQENPVAAVALSVDNLMLMANGDNRSTIVATVMDEANDTPRAAQMVTFTTSLGAVTPAVAETDAAGRVTTTLTSGNKAGVAIVEAHVDKVMASTPVVIAPVQNTGNDNETDADADAGADTGTDATPTDTAGMMTTLTIDGPDNGQLSHSYAFTVSVGPPDVMLPVTYLWEATGQRPQITWGGVEAFATWSWSSTGSKTITVTTVNEHNMLTQTYMIDIQQPVELPEQTLTTNRLYLPVVHRETLVGAASLRREGHHLYLPIINR